MTNAPGMWEGRMLVEPGFSRYNYIVGNFCGDIGIITYEGLLKPIFVMTNEFSDLQDMETVDSGLP
jgi:hypothetical protein